MVKVEREGRKCRVVFTYRDMGVYAYTDGSISEEDKMPPMG